MQEKTSGRGKNCLCDWREKPFFILLMCLLVKIHPGQHKHPVQTHPRRAAPTIQDGEWSTVELSEKQNFPIYFPLPVGFAPFTHALGGRRGRVSRWQRGRPQPGYQAEGKKDQGSATMAPNCRAHSDIGNTCLLERRKKSSWKSTQLLLAGGWEKAERGWRGSAGGHGRGAPHPCLPCPAPNAPCSPWASDVFSKS